MINSSTQGNNLKRTNSLNTSFGLQDKKTDKTKKEDVKEKPAKKKQVILMSSAGEQEQDLLNLPNEIHSRQRIFTKIIS